MVAIIVRIGLLAAGLGVTEIGLSEELTGGSAADGFLLLLVGLTLIVAGSAGFIVPLLDGRPREGRRDV